jgi:RNA polymerase sigma-70 factor (ECF subfamily)
MEFQVRHSSLPAGIEPAVPPAALAAIRAGEADVFGDLFMAHARSVYGFCGRRTGEWSHAEDLTSIVFLEAWRTRERAFVTQDGSPLAWLLGIARNVTAMSRRSRRRYDAALARFAGRAEARVASGASVVEDDALDAADRERVARLVAGAVSRLPRDVREVAELCLLAELDTAAAGHALGLPPSVVASRLGNARRQLRRLLRSREIGEPSWLIGNEQGERLPGAAADTKGA